MPPQGESAIHAALTKQVFTTWNQRTYCILATQLRKYCDLLLFLADMRVPTATDADVSIVGAGPFGLSAATYLKNKGLGIAIFGDPMSFWRDHMPAGMYLRSNWPASHISDPHGKLTLDH